MREHYGRGPIKAKTYVLDNLIVCVLSDGFTAIERTMMEGGEPDRVLEMRRDFQRMMKERYSEMIEELSGRKVLAFLSQAHVEPDLTIEIFLMDGPLAGFGALELVETTTDQPRQPGTTNTNRRPAAQIGRRPTEALTRDALAPLAGGNGGPSCCASRQRHRAALGKTSGHSPLTASNSAADARVRSGNLSRSSVSAVVLARLRPALRSRTPRPDAIAATRPNRRTSIPDGPRRPYHFLPLRPPGHRRRRRAQGCGSPETRSGQRRLASHLRKVRAIPRNPNPLAVQPHERDEPRTPLCNIIASPSPLVPLGMRSSERRVFLKRGKAALVRC